MSETGGVAEETKSASRVPAPAEGSTGAPRAESPPSVDLLVVRYSEIFLKGDNRGLFELSLEHNLKRSLRGLEGLRVERHHARTAIWKHSESADLETALTRVRRVFGVSSVSLAMSAPRDVDGLAERASALAREAQRRGAVTFKIKSRRGDKRFPVKSPQINDRVGRTVREATGLTVNLDAPDVTVTLEVGPRLAFATTHSAPGPGGLPVGVTGNVVLLLSGGIDSPVAGYLSQKRGCRLIGLYFHSFPYTGEAAKQKVIDLARELGVSQGGIRLVVIPFTELQEMFRDRANPRLLVILYRRAMMRIASRVARLEGALALATGENLGQVASQTIENLGCIEAVAELPVLRPLIAYDKAEIVALAKRIGTYETSVKPFDDCCSLFVPRHPATKGRVEDLAAAEAELPIDEMIERAVANRENVDLAD